MLQDIELSVTTLANAGISKPQKMQGQIFLDEYCEPERRYVFGPRDRGERP